MIDIKLSDKCRCERIDKLEEQLEQLQYSYKMLQETSFNKITELTKTNERYKKVLKIYSDKKNWYSYYDDGNILWKEGYGKCMNLNAYYSAQEVLEGKE